MLESTIQAVLQNKDKYLSDNDKANLEKRVTEMQQSFKDSMSKRLNWYENPVVEGAPWNDSDKNERELYSSPESLKFKEDKSILAYREQQLENSAEELRNAEQAALPKNIALVESIAVVMKNDYKMQDVYNKLQEQMENPQQKVKINCPGLKKLSFFENVALKLGRKVKTDEDNKKKLLEFERFKESVIAFQKAAPTRAKYPQSDLEKYESIVKNNLINCEERFKSECTKYISQAFYEDAAKKTVDQTNKTIEERLPEASKTRSDDILKKQQIVEDNNTAKEIELKKVARENIGIVDMQSNSGIDKLAEKEHKMKGLSPQQRLASRIKDFRGTGNVESSPVIKRTIDIKQIDNNKNRA